MAAPSTSEEGERATSYSARAAGAPDMKVSSRKGGPARRTRGGAPSQPQRGRHRPRRPPRHASGAPALASEVVEFPRRGDAEAGEAVSGVGDRDKPRVDTASAEVSRHSSSLRRKGVGVVLARNDHDARLARHFRGISDGDSLRLHAGCLRSRSHRGMSQGHDTSTAASISPRDFPISTPPIAAPPE